MSFGFEAINDNSSVIVSSESRPLVYVSRGQVSITNSVVDRPASGSAGFPAISTQAPPRVFVRLNSSRHSSMACYITINGSPGNWTSFTIYAAAQGGGTLPLYVVDYVLCVPSGGIGTDLTSGYGMVLYGEDGQAVFNHTQRIVKFSKFTKTWTYSKSGSNPTFHTLNSNVTIDLDDYIDITYFNRGTVLQQVVNIMFTGLVLYSSSTRVLRMQTQATNFTDEILDVGISNYCTPICKFPVAQYP